MMYYKYEVIVNEEIKTIVFETMDITQETTHQLTDEKH